MKGYAFAQAEPVHSVKLNPTPSFEITVSCFDDSIYIEPEVGFAMLEQASQAGCCRAYSNAPSQAISQTSRNTSRRKSGLSIRKVVPG